MKLEEAQDLLSDAMQSDLENGVKWLNEAAAAKFQKDYPALHAAIVQIMHAEPPTKEQA